MSNATNYQRTQAWLVACGKTRSAENASTQIGCHLEEFAEFLKCVRVDSDGHARMLAQAVDDLNWLAHKIKTRDVTAHIPTHLRADALDALCDSEVTGNGVAFLAGMDKPGADALVLDSNDAKLVDGKPVLLPGGKIGKPEGWKAPDLGAFV